MTANTNQASEDELTVEQILDGFGLFSRWYGFDEALGTKGRHTSSTPTEAIDKAKEAIEGLIRTEKLKLLDEVIHQSTVNLKSAKAVAGWAELRKEQLEAEL